MRAFRQSRSFVFAAGLALTAWFLGTNHCAIAGVVKMLSARQAHACCHPETTPSHSQTTPCCDSLSVPLDSAETHAPVLALHGIFPLSVDQPSLPLPVMGVLALDTGPPHVPGFALLVLNESLCAQAPPVFLV